MFYSCMVSMVLVLWNGYGIQGQNYIALLQGSGMPEGFLYINLILGICFRLLILNIFHWCNGYQIRVQIQWSEIVSREGKIRTLLFISDIVNLISKPSMEREGLMLLFWSALVVEGGW